MSLSPAQRAQMHDRDDGFPTEAVAGPARLGLLAAPAPSSVGGAGPGEEPGASSLATMLRRLCAAGLDPIRERHR